MIDRFPAASLCLDWRHKGDPLRFQGERPGARTRPNFFIAARMLALGASSQCMPCCQRTRKQTQNYSYDLLDLYIYIYMYIIVFLIYIYIYIYIHIHIISYHRIFRSFASAIFRIQECIQMFLLFLIHDATEVISRCIADAETKVGATPRIDRCGLKDEKDRQQWKYWGTVRCTLIAPLNQHEGIWY